MKEFNPGNIEALHKNLHIIVGLGNPGKEYEYTYHNIGMLCIKKFEDNENISSKTHASKIFTHSKIASKIFVTPLTFMNESGSAVQIALHYFKENPRSLLVIHDDSDLTLGDYKLDFAKGAAGHKGVASIISALGTKDFFRLRIGIRPSFSQEERRKKASEFVLKKMKKEELEILSHVFHTIYEKLFY
ncbi:MAG: aminoacyl-tRNA hydrolase [Patescibacteria group bacterium]